MYHHFTVKSGFNHLLTFAFLIFSIYYTGSLYVITITAENAYKNLKQLVDPLRQKLGIKDKNNFGDETNKLQGKLKSLNKGILLT